MDGKHTDRERVRERESERRRQSAVRFCQHEEFIPLEERKEASGPRGPTAKAAVEFVVCRKTVAGSSLFLKQHKTSCIRPLKLHDTTYTMQTIAVPSFNPVIKY